MNIQTTENRVDTEMSELKTGHRLERPTTEENFMFGKKQLNYRKASQQMDVSYKNDGIGSSKEGKNSKESGNVSDYKQQADENIQREDTETKNLSR